MRIRCCEPSDHEAIVRLSLRAWAPVFESLEQAMDRDVFDRFFPDWRISQQESVEAVCRDQEAKTWVADVDGQVAGFVAVYRRSEIMGEIYMIAVDPGFQRRDIGARLTEFAVRWMTEAGLTVAMVETGGDPGHAPARQLYERSGFRLLPVARYFKSLAPA